MGGRFFPSLTLLPNQYSDLRVDSQGRLMVVVDGGSGGGGGSGPVQVTGNVEAGQTDVGAPVKIGGRVATSSSPPPLLSEGQRHDIWIDRRGRPVVLLGMGENTVGVFSAQSANSDFSGSPSVLPVLNLNYLATGSGMSNWSREAGNWVVNVAAQATRTSTFTSAAQSNATNSRAFLNITTGAVDAGSQFTSIEYQVLLNGIWRTVGSCPAFNVSSNSAYIPLVINMSGSPPVELSETRYINFPLASTFRFVISQTATNINYIATLFYLR